MSDITKYAVFETALCIGGNLHEGEVLMVRAYEHDRELSALREELAEIKESLAYRGSLLNRTQQRAEAAEQRNADQYGLLLAWYENNAEGLIKVDDAAYHIVTATAEILDGKPTESGASE